MENPPDARARFQYSVVELLLLVMFSGTGCMLVQWCQPESRGIALVAGLVLTLIVIVSGWFAGLVFCADCGIERRGVRTLVVAGMMAMLLFIFLAPRFF